MRFKKGLQVVAMVDKGLPSGKGSIDNRFVRLSYPALKTYGVITDILRVNNTTKVVVSTLSGDTITYRPIELEPIEILRDIFDEYRYQRALSQLSEGELCRQG